MSNIDWDFIGSLEGKRILKGYVPRTKQMGSGVTIATGFDIGQRNLSDLAGLPNDIIELLKPYLGIKGAQAEAIASNLRISDSQAKIIDEFSHKEVLDDLRSKWKLATGESFDDLPIGKATVIASVRFQHGNLSTETPNFWRQVTSDDWDAAVQNLRNFQDDFPTRRNKEADYFLASKKKSEPEVALAMPSEDDAFVSEPAKDVTPVSEPQDIDATSVETVSIPEAQVDEGYDDSEIDSPVDKIVKNIVQAPPRKPILQVEAPPSKPQLQMEAPPSKPQLQMDAPPMRPSVTPSKPAPGLLTTAPDSQVVEDLDQAPDAPSRVNRALINPNNFEPRIFTKPEFKADPTLLETIGALNAYTYAPIFNYLGNAFAYRDRVQKGYNPMNDMQGYEAYASSLIRAQNSEHMAEMKREIDASIKNREILYGASIGKQFVAGIFDPINIVALPFGPTVGFARSALRTGTSLAILQAGQEAIRAPFDPVGTKEEVALNIGSAFVSGMALGGLVSIPLGIRSRAIKNTANELDQMVKVLDEAEVDVSQFGVPTKERPFANIRQDALEARVKRLPNRIDFLVKQLDEIQSNLDSAIGKVAKEQGVRMDVAQNIVNGQVRGIARAIDEYKIELSSLSKEADIRRKEFAAIQEAELKVPDPAGIAENAFTSSWLYRGITTPMKRFLQSKKLPTSVKLDMLRLAGDSGILLNMHKAGLNSGSSVYQAAQVWNGNWARSNKKLQDLWARDTDTANLRLLDYNTTAIARGIKSKFVPEANTYEQWLDNIGELYVKGEKNLTDLQQEAVAEIRSFYKDWEEKLSSVGLIGSRKEMESRAFNIEADIEVIKGRIQKSKNKQQIEYNQARLARLENELEEIQGNIETMKEYKILPANEEDMFPRYWNKEYIKQNRARLEAVLYDWYYKNPYIFEKNLSTGKYEKKMLSTDPEMVMGRARKSVDEILGITDVADDANAFYGHGKSKHFRHRSIDIPNKLVTEFIVKNPVKVMKAYTHRVAPKYEFALKFGGRNVEDVLDEMTENMFDAGMTARQVYAARKDFRHMYDRVVGSVLRDPTAMNQRISNIMRFAAETNYLGSAGFSTLPDAAKIIMEHELGTVTKTLLSIVESKGLLLEGKEGKLAGEILEIEMGSAHMRMVEDLNNNPLEQGILDKGRNVAYALNLLAPMTNVMKRIESLARGHTIIDYSIKYSQGKASKFEVEYLNRYNIDKNKAIEIANAPWEKTKVGLYLPNTDAWADAIQFPSTTANVMRGPTGKFVGNRYVPAFFRRKDNTIHIDEDYIRNTAFPAKVWTQPRVKGVEPLDADAFRTPQEYINFVMMHEIMHTKVSAGQLGIDLTQKGGKAAYENKINEMAMLEMKRQKTIQGDTIASFREAMNSGIMNTVIMGTPADKPIITDGVAYVPMSVGKKLGMKEDAQYIGYARVENALIGLPFQFMSYSLGAANKITAAYAQNQIRNKTAGVLTSLALGYAVVKFKTPDFVWDEMSSQDKLARSIDASGLAALWSDLMYESMAMSSAFGTPDVSMGLLQPKYPEDDPYAAVIGGVGGAGPSITYDLATGVGQFINGEYGDGAKNVVRNLPFMRLWFLKDQMNEITRGWARY